MHTRYDQWVSEQDVDLQVYNSCKFSCKVAEIERENFDNYITVCMCKCTGSIIFSFPVYAGASESSLPCPFNRLLYLILRGRQSVHAHAQCAVRSCCTGNIAVKILYIVLRRNKYRCNDNRFWFV